MERNESSGGLGSYYHHQQQPTPLPQHHQPTPTTNTNASPTNGMSYSHSVPSAVSSPLDSVRRKRGRPRKYGTPQQAAAAKRLSSSSSLPKKKDQLLVSAGNMAQGFVPHIISVAAGEDVGQKIMLFMQQSKREICILSASGSISNVSLRQPATSGGNITYEGRFDIITLSGSYVRTELGGRTGGLSVCLSCTDGQIVGGGVGGPLMAAGPVQVIVGTFLSNTKKDITAGVKGDDSASKFPSPTGGAPFSSLGFQSAVDSSGSQFIIQPRSTQVTPSWSTDWRVSTDSRSNTGYELTGSIGLGAQQSAPVNGKYDTDS